MAVHGFAGTNGHSACCVTEGNFHGRGFGHIADRRGRAVSVDVTDVVRRELRVTQGEGNSPRLPSRRRLGNVLRIAGGAKARDLRINFCTAFEGVIFFFQDQCRRTFTDDEARAVFRERTA